MKKASKKAQKKTSSISKRKLAAYGLGIGGCGAMLAGSAEAVLVDATFAFGSELTLADGIAGQSTVNLSTVPVGRISWRGEPAFGVDHVNLGSYVVGGFYQAGSPAGTFLGTPVYSPNNATVTFGTGVFLSSTVSLGKAIFSGYSNEGGLGADAEGVIGFKTTTDPFGSSGDGHWGYINFKWDDANRILEVVSAKVQSTLNAPATFTVSAVPEANPATLMALFSLGAVGLRTARRRKAAAA